MGYVGRGGVGVQGGFREVVWGMFGSAAEIGRWLCVLGIKGEGFFLIRG